MSNFVIPGDLEKPAWQKLLQNPNFCNRLRRVSVFIASHHGRTSGYCREVFDYCSPAVIIFSDGPKQFATQEEANTYAAHASGVNFQWTQPACIDDQKRPQHFLEFLNVSYREVSLRRISAPPSTATRLGNCSAAVLHARSFISHLPPVSQQGQRPEVTDLLFPWAPSFFLRCYPSYKAKLAHQKFP